MGVAYVLIGFVPASLSAASAQVTLLGSPLGEGVRKDFIVRPGAVDPTRCSVGTTPRPSPLPPSLIPFSSLMPLCCA